MALPHSLEGNAMPRPDQPEEESESTRQERHRRAERRHWAFEKIGGFVAISFTAIAAGGAVASAIASFGAWDAADNAVKAALAANQINSRPYIKVKLEPGTFLMHTTGGVPGDFSGVKILVQNIGKLPGLAWIQDGISWNGRGHPGDENNWQERGVIGKIFLFPEPISTSFDSEGLVLTQGQLTDLGSSGGTLYVMADVLYGPSKNIEAEGPSRDYETKVCSLYRINPPANGGNELRLDPNGSPCPSDGSNYAK